MAKERRVSNQNWLVQLFNHGFDGRAHAQAMAAGITEKQMVEAIRRQMAASGRNFSDSDIAGALIKAQTAHEQIARNGTRPPEQMVRANNIVFRLFDLLFPN